MRFLVQSNNKNKLINAFSTIGIYNFDTLIYEKNLLLTNSYLIRDIVYIPNSYLIGITLDHYSN